MKKRFLAILLTLVMAFALLSEASAATVSFQEQVYANMIALKISYPEGTKWTNDNYYAWKGGVFSGGYGCAGFAFMLSDAAFGDLPARKFTSFQYSDVKVGDILRTNHDTHTVIVLEVHENNVILAEGNYNSSVHWGRSLSRQEVMAADYLMTRYPEQTTQPEQPAAPIYDPADFDIANGELTKYKGAGGDVTIPSGVTKIGSSAFSGCIALTSVTIPDSVTSIDSYAFRDCTSLAKVTIPSGVNSIDWGAFENTPWLKQQGEFAVVNGILLAYQGDGGSVTIPGSVTSIGVAAFYQCNSVTSVTIPNSVTTIRRHGLSNCRNMTAVTIPNSVTTIEEGAFTACVKLTSITIPSSVTSIGKEAFGTCTGLTSITIPASVTSIGEIPFYYCTNLVSIQVDPGNQNYISENGVLYTRDRKTLVAYPLGKQGAYAIPDGVTSIGENLFAYCRNLTGITIPSSVTSIEKRAFVDCTGLTSVTIPDSVTTIGTYAFAGCKNLTSIKLPDRATEIKDAAFEECASLTSIAIPDGVTSIRDITFLWCSGLTSVTIPCSVNKICQRAFEDCTSLKDVYFTGTQAQWDAIEIEWYGNDALKSVTVHYSTAPSQPTITFTDVPANEWYADAVAWAVKNNITDGTGNGTFSPKNVCTHDHILTFLWRAAGRPASTGQLPFTPKNNWAADALRWAYEKGMIGTSFNEEAACTRADAVMYIWQAFGSPAPDKAASFSDVPPGANYVQAVSWAAGKGIVGGTSATTFSPNQSCDRGTIVTLLQRAYEN